MNKEKLFIWCDSPTVPTGFGTVAKHLFQDLHKKFDVSILGINYWGNERYDSSKYFIYSVDKSDALGLQSMGKILADAKPDKILLFQDIFHIQSAVPIIRDKFPKVKIMAYFPIDGRPVNLYWKPGFDTPDKLVTYTKWAIDSIHLTFPEMVKKNIEYLYHGVDTANYKVLPSGVRQRFKEQYNWGDRFLVVSNNRFQPRKGLSLTMRAFALFTKGYKQCDCGNVYLPKLKNCDLNGCDASHVVKEVTGHDDATIYFHANMFEKIMGPGVNNSLGSAAVNAGFEAKDIPKLVAFFTGNAYENPYTDNQMSILYNIADVNISTSYGEGVGLSLIESAACGTTSIAPNNSAIPEMLGDTGHLVKNDALITIAQDNNHARPVVSVKGVVEALEIEYQKWLANGKRKVVNDAAVKRVNELFLWEDKREKLTNWLTNL